MIETDLMPRRKPWIVSAPFDLSLFLGPPILSVCLVLLVPGLRAADTPVWGWVLLVVFVDVAHVYSSLYRTYFDREEFQRRKGLYLLTPLACFIAGAALYSFGGLVFWRVLAYVAVFHFVRQQYGFLMLYKHGAGERSILDRRIDKCTIYLTMLYPLAFWHQDLANRHFDWFVSGDFISLPSWTAAAVLWLYSASLAVFAVRQAQVFFQTGSANLGKIGIVGATAAVWYVGIVFLNSDFAFTLTNVVAHGVPYIALVWLYGRRKWKNSSGWQERIHRPSYWAAFLGLLFLIAYFEEGIWDLLVWQEHPAVFGGLHLGLELPPLALTLLVPLLTVPQATHYVLDAWIWKFDGSNPGLREYLFGSEEKAK